MNNKKNYQMWVTPKFRKFLYSKKAEDPSKTLFDIQDSLAESLSAQKFKENEPKFKKEKLFPKF